jgi:hypothetical protein
VQRLRGGRRVPERHIPRDLSKHVEFIRVEHGRSRGRLVTRHGAERLQAPRERRQEAEGSEQRGAAFELPLL